MNARSTFTCAMLLAAPCLSTSSAGQANASLPTAASQRIDSVALAELASTRTPGSSLVIVKGDQIVSAKGYGVANVETNQPVTPDQLFRLGSTTKMMTALAALSLAARGVLDLDRAIGAYVPAISSAQLRSVTLRQLLTHTAGLLDYTSMQGPHGDEALNAFVPTLTDTVFFTHPGDIMSYSNLGYVVVGYLLSEVTKKPYADVMHDEVFAPLGMTHSTMRPVDAMTQPLAQGHQGGRGGGTMQVIRPAPDDARYWPAGSAFTSVLDFARLAAAMMNEGRVGGQQALSAAVVRTWLTPFVKVAGDTSATPDRYGYGLSTGTVGGEVMVQHGGSRAGYGSMFRMIPSRKLAVIVLGNQSGIALRRTLDAATSAMAPELQLGQPARASGQPLPQSELAGLAGSYRNGRSNGVNIAADGGQLRLTQVGATAAGAVVEKLGTNWYVAGSSRFAVVRGADGKTTYVVSGLRAMRKQD